MDQRLSEAQSLFHPPGKRADLFMFCIDKIGFFKQGTDAVFRFVFAQTINVCRECQKLFGRHPFIKLRILRQIRSEEHTSELQSRENLVCRLLLEKKDNIWKQL